MIGIMYDFSILILDKSGNIESCNSKSEKIRGYQLSEIAGKNLQIFYTKEDVENGLPQNLINRATLNGAVKHKAWNVNKNGTKHWSDLELTALYNNTGLLTGFSSMSRNLHGKQYGEAHEPNCDSSEIDRNNMFALINNTNDPMWSVDRNYKLITSNHAFDGMVKNMSGNTIAKGSDVLAMGFTTERLARYKELYDRAFSGETFTVTEFTELPVVYWSELSFHQIRLGHEVVGTACYAHDITKLKLAEEKMMNTQRLYEFISQINHAITHATDEEMLFQKACNIAVNNGKYDISWVGSPDIVNKKNIVIAHNINARASDISALENLKYDDNGPTAIVMRSGEYYVNNDFGNTPVIISSKIFVEQRGYKSLIVLPIKKSGKTIATYNLLSMYVNLFNEQEIRLLKEAANDISFALDVFEKEQRRKQMEGEVAHSELRLKNAQAIAHFGHWELKFSNGIAEWSEEACRIYGLSPDDNLHTYPAWLSFIHPDDLAHVNKAIKESQDTLSNSAFHHRIIRRDGTVRYIFSQAHFEFNEAGKPVALHGVAHDETETKEAENSLAQSEANLTQIIDLIPQCIFTKDYDGKYIFTNKTYAALYGYTPEQINKKVMTDVIPRSDLAEHYLQEDQQVISSGQTKIIPEVAFNDHKGDARLVHIVKVPFTIASTNKRSVLVVMNDITEQKKAEKERAKIVADIIQRNNDLEQFSYIVSHNLRAPVAHIQGLVDIIQTVGIDKEEEAITISFLVSATKNLDHVIRDLNQILDLKHSVNEVKENLIFDDILSEVKSSIYSTFSDEPVNIFSDFSEVPKIYSIKSYLYSIFINLISNSIKYRQPGILPVINICCHKINGSIQLTFRDNGLGIDITKEGDEVFGLYKRFHHHVEGKGMGLYIVKSQVELLGGKITVISEVNKGTEFCISFE